MSAASGSTTRTERPAPPVAGVITLPDAETNPARAPDLRGNRHRACVAHRLSAAGEGASSGGEARTGPAGSRDAQIRAFMNWYPESSRVPPIPSPTSR